LCAFSAGDFGCFHLCLEVADFREVSATAANMFAIDQTLVQTDFAGNINLYVKINFEMHDCAPPEPVGPPYLSPAN
jgi:hypothetical protein